MCTINPMNSKPSEKRTYITPPLGQLFSYSPFKLIVETILIFVPILGFFTWQP